MSYNKTDAAKALGISKKELENRAKAAGFNNTEEYFNMIGGFAAPALKKITDEIKNQIIELDRELDNLGQLGLTQEEKDAFLQQAITQVQPYYDTKVSEIQAGIEEGKIRTAEDILLATRDVENDVRTKLEDYDLRTAETEEDFLNKLGRITSTTSENVQAKTEEWRLRLEGLKMDQIQSGIFASGIGKQKRQEYERLKGMEIGDIMAESQRQQTEAETAKKYTLDQIRLAREAAERDRATAIGAPTTQQALQTLGLEDLSQLGPKTAIEQARSAPGRSIPAYEQGYGSQLLTETEAQRRLATESRRMELENQRKAEYDVEYEKKKQKVLADKAAAQSRLSSYPAYYR